MSATPAPCGYHAISWQLWGGGPGSRVHLFRSTNLVGTPICGAFPRGQHRFPEYSPEGLERAEERAGLCIRCWKGRAPRLPVARLRRTPRSQWHKDAESQWSVMDANRRTLLGHVWRVGPNLWRHTYIEPDEPQRVYATRPQAVYDLRLEVRRSRLLGHPLRAMLLEAINGE